MIHAYDSLYLGKTSRTLGNMLHTAVQDYWIDGAKFLQYFIQSGVAEQFETGNPMYIAGKSGHELVLEVMEKVSGMAYEKKEVMPAYDRSDVYWVGWMIAHYQWYSGRTFKNILDTVSYEEFLSLYGTLHEADIQKCYDVLDAHFAVEESRLKAIRVRCDMTQEALASRSGVPLSTIRAYERKAKDMRKAGVGTVMQLAKVLKCDVSELIG